MSSEAAGPKGDPGLEKDARPGNVPEPDKGPVPKSESGAVPAQPVGLGQVLERVRTPAELGIPTVVEFIKVTKTYNPGRPGAFTAIRDVTFAVADLPDKGEFICVLGPSGCGKSTRMMCSFGPRR